MEAEVPILGLCFGGQMLARVLGGEVYRGGQGRDRLAPGPDEGADLVPEGPWFQWHFDSSRRRRARTSSPRPTSGRRRSSSGAASGSSSIPRSRPRSWTSGSAPTGTSSTSTASTRTRSSPRRDEPPRSTAGRLELLDALLERVARLGERLMTAERAGRRRPDAVFPRDLDWAYPNVERGEGVWLTTGGRAADPRRAVGGGAMVACLGHGVPDVVEAAAAAGRALSYFYNHHFTNEPQERLGRRILEVAAPEMARVRFVTGGRRRTRWRCSWRAAITWTRGRRSLARDLAGAGLSRGHLGTLRSHGRPHSRTPTSPTSPSPHIPPSDVAARPERARRLDELDRAARGGRARHGGRVRLRARECRRAARLLAARSLLARPGGAAREHGFSSSSTRW